MNHYEHLQLVRLPQRFERRKRKGGVPTIKRDLDGRRRHSTLVETQLNNAIAIQRDRRKPQFVDPSLILRVRMTGGIQENEWERLGLSLLSSDPDKTLVLFSSDEDLNDFRMKLHAYASEVPPGQKSARFENFIGSIESIGAIEPKDRIGLRFRDEGVSEVDEFLPDVSYTVDIELWDFGSRNLREIKLNSLTGFIEENGGDVIDQYIGPSITLMRVLAGGSVIQQLLEVDEISCIDMLPSPDLFTSEALNFEIDRMPEPSLINADAPVIGVIDSGVNAHPLIENLIVGSISVPENLGIVDDYGHGTRVAGIAVYGDLRGQLSSGQLIPSARLCSAKVVDSRGCFDDLILVPNIMRQAISELVRRFGARIINISLGDIKSPYKGGRIGVWGATLDELARELDVLIIVSAGNRCPRGGTLVEEGVTQYPRYLLEENNKILEPAGAVNVLTVGSISHHSGLDSELLRYSSNIPITERYEPSPFTRVGPGIGGMLKPDLVDFGGTMIYDALIGKLKAGEEVPSAGMLTLNHLFLEQALRCGSGTSYSAPMIANKAAYLLTQLPNASTNLIKALLVGGAAIPQDAASRLGAMVDSNEVKSIYGHGQADVIKATYSSENRVVLYADDSLEKDHFVVYEVPIPTEYQTVKGVRELKVTLAYNPPTRHSRADYMGITMNFRVVRGKDPEFIFEHYRRRTEAEGSAPELPNRYNCDLQPGPASRDKSTIQTGTIRFQRDIQAYGDRYFLVVRCLSGWADYVASQSFSVVVELSHQADIKLYQRVQQRVRTRVQA